MEAPSRSNPAVAGVILWDIDGTLIDVTSSRQDKHRAAAEAVLERSIDPPESWTGRTDAEILHSLATGAGAALDDTARSAMIRELDRLTYSELSLHPTTATPGVVGALEAAAERGWVNGLVTGNSAGRAKAKLTSAGLGSLIDWRHCHFGETARTRLDLVQASLAGTARLAPDRPVVVVGDTPLDIVAAHGAGLPIVAVATGKYGAETLLNALPDLLIENLLTGLDALVNFLDQRTKALG